MSQSILLVSHKHREEIKEAANLTRQIAGALGLRIHDAVDPDDPPNLVLALGGDGTILGAAETAHELDIPLLGVNFGHMGFLAETSGETLPAVLNQVAEIDYSVDPRMTLRVVIRNTDGSWHEDWALNEAVVLHTDMARPAEFAFAVDKQVVSTYAADGIILATPTGSTAYAYSAGGPVVWPDTKAIVMAPLAAHGLFTRPLVVSPKSFLEVAVLSTNLETSKVWLDGRRSIDAPPGSIVEVSKGDKPLKVVRLGDTPFSKRLVTKFSLPVSGWRDNGAENSDA